ncbi:hypothetical protein TL16_g10491 [Triparma laevis f. inornata]|uniref:Uncharacterized protein n=1 Tax=Triparma laevis f. inornata TaxID=1714386 RepID=A0A9W7EQI0_9STRA|nr:hypothetical protein TL16_g10491 [Triparma laevis f. inornata]
MRSEATSKVESALSISLNSNSLMLVATLVADQRVQRVVDFGGGAGGEWLEGESKVVVYMRGAKRRARNTFKYGRLQA